MNYISIYSTPTEPVTSRQATPTNSLTGERVYANDEACYPEVDSISNLTVLAEVDHHQPSRVIPYAALDLRHREDPQLYTTPQNIPED